MLEFDDVLNEQRKFIYAKRDEIMAAGNLIERVISTASDEVAALSEEAADDRGTGGDWNAVLGALETRYFFAPEHPAEHYAALPRSKLEQTLAGELRRTLEAKAAEIGAGAFNLFIRYEYLRAIDARWQDHLESLGALQEAVRLRAYSQKNPLLEYKLEGFQIFDRMLERDPPGDCREDLQGDYPSQRPATCSRGALRRAPPPATCRWVSSEAPAPRPRPGLPAATALPSQEPRRPWPRPAAARVALGHRAAAVQNVTGAIPAQRALPKVGRNEPLPLRQRQEVQALPRHLTGRGRSAQTGNQLRRVELDVTAANLEVEMGTGRAAGRPDAADRLALRTLCPRLTWIRSRWPYSDE